MDVRSVVLVGMVSGAGLVGLTSACSGPDPGEITFHERVRGSTGVDVTGGGTSGATPEAGATSGGGLGSSGTSGGGAPSAGDPVFGTTTFAAGNPGRGAPAKAANGAHQGDASGKNCIVAGCHQGGWAFGGTLYTDAAGTARVAGAEIRVANPDGSEFAKTFSDADGNFWTSFVTPIPANSRVGVRTADGKKLTMVGAISAGQAGCNQAGACHGGTAGKVYIK
jgi:hypothetical protein